MAICYYNCHGKTTCVNRHIHVNVHSSFLIAEFVGISFGRSERMGKKLRPKNFQIPKKSVSVSMSNSTLIIRGTIRRGVLSPALKRRFKFNKNAGQLRFSLDR